jgi:hypothetical protein
VFTCTVAISPITPSTKYIVISSIIDLYYSDSQGREDPQARNDSREKVIYGSLWRKKRMRRSAGYTHAASRTGWQNELLGTINVVWDIRRHEIL